MGTPDDGVTRCFTVCGLSDKSTKKEKKKENGGLKRNSRLLHVLEHRRSAAGTESLGTKAENRSVSRLFLTHSALCDAALCRSDTGLLLLAATCAAFKDPL